MTPAVAATQIKQKQQVECPSCRVPLPGWLVSRILGVAAGREYTNIEALHFSQVAGLTLRQCPITDCSYQFELDEDRQKQLESGQLEWGFNMLPVPVGVALCGQKVVNVAPGSQAALAGVKRGWNVVQVSGRLVHDAQVSMHWW